MDVGSNTSGALGQKRDNSVLGNVSSPIQILVLLGQNFSRWSYDALQSKLMELYGYGDGMTNGQLGHKIIQQIIHHQFKYLGTTWKTSYHANTLSYARKTDGTLWSWGEGIHGGLGQKMSNSIFITSSNSWYFMEKCGIQAVSIGNGN